MSIMSELEIEQKLRAVCEAANELWDFLLTDERCMRLRRENGALYELIQRLEEVLKEAGY